MDLVLRRVQLEYVAARLDQLEHNLVEAYVRPMESVRRILDARHKTAPGFTTVVHRMRMALDGGRVDKDGRLPPTLTRELCVRYNLRLGELVGDNAGLTFRTLVALGVICSPADLEMLQARAEDFVTTRARVSPEDIGRFLGEPGKAYVRCHLLTAEAWRRTTMWRAADLVTLGVRIKRGHATNWPAWRAALTVEGSKRGSTAVVRVWERGTAEEWLAIGLDARTPQGQMLLKINRLALRTRATATVTTNL